MDLESYKLDFASHQRAKKLTDAELSRRLGKSVSYVYALKKGNMISLATLYKLCSVLEVSPSDILKEVK